MIKIYAGIGSRKTPKEILEKITELLKLSKLRNMENCGNDYD